MKKHCLQMCGVVFYYGILAFCISTSAMMTRILVLCGNVAYHVSYCQLLYLHTHMSDNMRLTVVVSMN